MTDSQEDSLPAALARYGLQLEPDALQQTERYCRQLWDWNEKLNLTRHTDWDKFVARDLVDVLELSRLIDPGREVLDVGTGGGVPGVVLAILRPDLDVSVSESVGKKARVVQAIVRELQLPVTVYAERAEKVLEDFRYDTLVARAVGPLWKICKWFQGHWHDFGCLLAIKGPRWVEERAEARERGLLKNVALRRVASYPLLGTASESVILKLQARSNAGPAEPDD